MPDRHPFYDSRKFKELEEAVMTIIHGLFAPVEQTNYDGNEINQNGNEFWVNFLFSFDNETQLKVRCDLEYHGQCASLKQITFLSK
jgi:hypothetical protein